MDDFWDKVRNEQRLGGLTGRDSFYSKRLMHARLSLASQSEQTPSRDGRVFIVNNLMQGFARTP